VSALLLAVAALLVLTIVAGLLRVARGPTEADRMLGAQLFGTTGVAVLLLLGRALAAPSYWDVALVFAVLAAITAIAFVRRAGGPVTPGSAGGSDGRG
jgi:multicomponent Na+:H+ antiporter subunit F